MKKNILSSIFSTIHECGHAIYEQQIDDSISDTILGEGTSMGIHESQSRLFENMFGRNFNFWKKYILSLMNYLILKQME